jgi:hypothetical protein
MRSTAAATVAMEWPLAGGSSVTTTSPPARSTPRSARSLWRGSARAGRIVNAIAWSWPPSRSIAASSGAM